MNFLIQSGPGIGDIVQLLSMVCAIKKHNNTARVDLLICGSATIYNTAMQIVDCQDYIDNIYWYSVKSPFHDLVLLKSLYKNHYDYGFVRISSVTGNRSLWNYRIMRLSCVKTIVGTGYDEVDIPVEVPPDTHYLLRDQNMLNAIGIFSQPDSVIINKSRLDFSYYATLNLNKLLKTVVISIGTNLMTWKEAGKTIYYDVKSWGLENWINLADMLHNAGCNVIIIGGNKEKLELKKKNLIIKEYSGLVNAVGNTSISQSIALLSEASLAIGSEGGMMHCAAAAGTKTLTVFGGSNYKMWNPGGCDSEIMFSNLKCQPCFGTKRAALCTNKKCLNTISVKAVFSKAMSILGMENINYEN